MAWSSASNRPSATGIKDAGVAQGLDLIGAQAGRFAKGVLADSSAPAPEQGGLKFNQGAHVMPPVHLFQKALDGGQRQPVTGLDLFDKCHPRHARRMIVGHVALGANRLGKQAGIHV
jgi:hypothetical protein